MRLGEKFQYKIRNYLYEVERSKKQRQGTKKRVDKKDDSGISQVGAIFSEMDEYLGELFENLAHKKDTKRKN